MRAAPKARAAFCGRGPKLALGKESGKSRSPQSAGRSYSAEAVPERKGVERETLRNGVSLADHAGCPRGSHDDSSWRNAHGPIPGRLEGMVQSQGGCGMGWGLLAKRAAGARHWKGGELGDWERTERRSAGNGIVVGHGLEPTEAEPVHTEGRSTQTYADLKGARC